MKYAHLLCQFLFTKKVKHWIAAILKQKMRQNVHQIVFQFPFFRTPPLGALPQTPGEGRGGKGRERAGEGKWKGRGGEVCVIAVGGDRRPWTDGHILPLYPCY